MEALVIFPVSFDVNDPQSCWWAVKVPDQVRWELVQPFRVELSPVTRRLLPSSLGSSFAEIIRLP